MMVNFSNRSAYPINQYPGFQGGGVSTPVGSKDRLTFSGEGQTLRAIAAQEQPQAVGKDLSDRDLSIGKFQKGERDFYDAPCTIDGTVYRLRVAFNRQGELCYVSLADNTQDKPYFYINLDIEKGSRSPGINMSFIHDLAGQESRRIFYESTFRSGYYFNPRTTDSAEQFDFERALRPEPWQKALFDNILPPVFEALKNQNIPVILPDLPSRSE